MTIMRNTPATKATMEPEPLAVIGMASEFAQEADSTGNLWKLLLEGRSTMTPVPKERFNAEGYWHPDPNRTESFHVKGAHFMKSDPACFDSQFFNITKAETLTMDPQQRVTLESVYRAIENAGIPLKTAMGSNTSVFASGVNHDYNAIVNRNYSSSARYLPTGTSDALISNRVSWFFDFKGPSLTLDTACSSTLVALHLGCQSLRARESDMSIISGVNLCLLPDNFTNMAPHGFLSPDGKCYTFDHRANGYSRGEGAGSIVVKRLSDAIRDGNTIRAVVRGTRTNQDGRTPGITLPNGESQEALIRECYAAAGLDVRDTIFVEAHGTGTAAGDPVEARAIASAFETASRSADRSLYLGAMKAAIGHLEGAAGVAGLIKSILILESGVIPPNANLEKINPKTPADKWNLKFPTAPMPWPAEGVRRISFNGMGFGGANAHAILDDACSYLSSHRLQGLHRTVLNPPDQQSLSRRLAELGVKQEPSLGNETHSDEHHTTNGITNGHATTAGLTNGTHATNGLVNGHTIGAHTNGEQSASREKPRIFVWHAFDDGGIERNTKKLSEYLTALPHMNLRTEQHVLDDMAYTLSAKRTVFPWRSFCIVDSVAGLAEKTKSISSLSKPTRAGSRPRLCMVFTGQGAQYCAMGRQLLVFRRFEESLEEASAYMKALGSSWNLLEEILKDDSTTNINHPSISQPACAAIQIALCDLLADWGIFPNRVVGHSSGEIAAAYAARKLGRQDAWKVAYYRGVVTSKKLEKKGAMMAVGASEEDLVQYIDIVNEQLPGELVIACYNSPKNLTVSGDKAKIDMLKERLDAKKIFARTLKVPNAYHSAHMKVLSREYASLLGRLIGNDLQHATRLEDIQMISSVTGKVVDADRIRSAEYWISNLESPVRFTAALLEACTANVSPGRKSGRINARAGQVFVDQVIEIGPHSALRSAITEITKSRSATSSIGYSSALNRNSASASTTLSAAAQLYCQGYPVDLLAINEEFADGSRASQQLVDLPSYEFDHSDTQWSESRISRNIRHKKFVGHDLCGSMDYDWNAKMPRWRYNLRVEENPWLRDHIVTGLNVFPGMGYFVMVLEASRQVTDPNLQVTGFRFQDVSMHTALMLPETGEVEVSLSLIPKDDSSMDNSKFWNKFIINSYDANSDSWIEHCKGYIATEYIAATGPVDNGREAEAEAKAWTEALALMDKCTSQVDISSVYDSMRDVGIDLRHYFNNLTGVKIAKGTGEARGIVTVPNIAESMPKNHVHEHIIHPTTLDSMLQLFIVAIPDHLNVARLQTAIMPTFCKEMWISANMNSNAGHQYHCHSRSWSVAIQKFQGDISVWDTDADKPAVMIKGVQGTPVSNIDDTSGIQRKLCWEMQWKPDLDLLKGKSIPGVNIESPEKSKERRVNFEESQLAMALIVTEALEDIKQKPLESCDGHLNKFVEWLHHIKQTLEADKLFCCPLDVYKEYEADATKKEAIFSKVESNDAGGKLALRMGKNITQVLRGEADPMHLMFGVDNTIEKMYDFIASSGGVDHLMNAYWEIVHHGATDLKILEIGAGTGSFTLGALNALAPRDATGSASTAPSAVAKYTFSDVSAGFFEKAGQRFHNWSSLLDFKTLNCEAPIEAQGFEEGAYDIIIAANVLHATKDLVATLSNVRRLLKPGGKLVLQEGTTLDLVQFTMSFGMLPGWWLSVEPSRKWGPWTSEQNWNEFLVKSGFSPMHTVMKDSADPELKVVVNFVADAVAKEVSAPVLPQKTVILSSSDASSDAVSQALEKSLLSQLGLSNCRVLNWQDVEITADWKNTVCISLLEIEKPFLNRPSESDFDKLRELMSNCKGMLWVTGDPKKDPVLAMSIGLLRSMRWERDVDSANLVHLSIRDVVSATELVSSSICDLFRHQFIGSDSVKANAEYYVEDGIFYSARIVESTKGNDYLQSKNVALPAQMLPLGDVEEERPLKLNIRSIGLLNSLEFVTDPLYNQPLADDDAEIRVKAVGLNFRDIMISMGEHNAMSFGSEAAGIVTRLGRKVKNLTVGDRVVWMGGVEGSGSFQTYARMRASQVARLPDLISFEAAAALPSVYITAVYGLHRVAHLQKGESILIHGAAGGVGQAAITLANLVGAEVFATCSTTEKAELLMNEFGVKRDHIFSSRDLSFAKGVMRMTHQRGVDVILNCLSGDALRASWECIAPLGRFIEIGKRDAQNNARVSLQPFLRNVMMASVEMPTIMRHRPAEAQSVLEEVVQMYVDGKIREATPMTVYRYDQMEEAFRKLQSGKGMGKLVISPSPTDVVPIVPASLTPFKIESDASYLLAGGLGGLGRSFAIWMAERGAKNLIFVSRSGAASAKAKEAVEELESMGVKVTVFACGTHDRSALSEAIKKCRVSLPPIKGCVQGSMVLSDSMFNNMTHEDYMTAVKPKVDGSWNLHELLPKDMNFFVLLSSITGVIGSRSQANYATGNTFQDALAEYRIAQGLPAMSLDLGGIRSAGYVAENQDRVFASNALTDSVNLLFLDEVHAMFEFALDSRIDRKMSQLASGLTTAARCKTLGIELPFWITSPLFTQLSSISAASGDFAAESGDNENVVALLRAAASLPEAVEVICEAIHTKLSKLLNIKADNVDLSRSVSSHGVDSLVAVELRTWIAKALGADIPMLDIMGTMPIGGADGLAQKIAGGSKLVHFE